MKEFFKSVQQGKDSEQSWKKAIYKIIARLDDSVPEYFKSPTFLDQLEWRYWESSFYQCSNLFVPIHKQYSNLSVLSIFLVIPHWILIPWIKIWWYRIPPTVIHTFTIVHITNFDIRIIRISKKRTKLLRIIIPEV